MEAFDLTRLTSEHDPSEEPYLVFLRVPPQTEPKERIP